MIKAEKVRFPREIIEILGYSGGRGGLTIDFVVGTLNADDDNDLYCHLHFSEVATFRYHDDESYQLGFCKEYLKGSKDASLNEKIPDLDVWEKSLWLEKFLSQESHLPFMNPDSVYKHYRLYSYPSGVFDVISSQEPTLKV